MDFTDYYLWFYGVAPYPRAGDKSALLYREQARRTSCREFRLRRSRPIPMRA